MVDRCRAKEYPPAVARLSSGWVVMGERQVLTGYCLLLPDPVVPHLNALPPELRAQFLADMALVGDALLALTAGLRINYAIFGNVDPALHAHVFPRHPRNPTPRERRSRGRSTGVLRRAFPTVARRTQKTHSGRH